MWKSIEHFIRDSNNLLLVLWIIRVWRWRWLTMFTKRCANKPRSIFLLNCNHQMNWNRVKVVTCRVSVFRPLASLTFSHRSSYSCFNAVGIISLLTSQFRSFSLDVVGLVYVTCVVCNSEVLKERLHLLFRSHCLCAA